MMIRLMTLFLSLFVWQHSQAQENDWHFHHLNVQNGLSEATNFYTYKDSRGFVWISSISGLNRFDGRQVRVYQPDLADSTAIFGQNIQSNFFEDTQGDIWFSTYEGINRYIRKNDCFEHFILKNKENQAFLGYKVCHLDNDGNLWLLVGEQTVHLFNIKKHIFQRLHTIKNNAQTLAVQLFPNVKRSFAYSWNAGQIGFEMTTYLPNGEMSSKILFDKTSKGPLSIYDILVESDTLIRLVTEQKGILNFNPTTLTVETSQEIVDKPNVIVNRGENELLVSTRFNGIHVFDKATKRYTQSFRHNPSMPNSLTDNTIGNVYQDADEGVWASINNRGVDFTVPEKSKFKRQLHISNDSSVKKPLIISALNADFEGTLWYCATKGGLKNIKQKENTNLKDAVGLQIQKNTNNELIHQMFTDKQKRLWLMNWSSLEVYDTKKRVLKKIADATHFFLYGIKTKEDKMLLAALTDGVFEAIEQTNGSFQFQKITAIPQSYTILAEDNEGLLWCSDAVVVHVYDPKNNYKLVRELPLATIVTGFHFPKNGTNAYIATYNGLVEINKSNNWQSTTYNEKDGLPSRTINTMQADAKGNLWLGTTKGLAKWDPREGGTGSSVSKAKSYNLTDGISDLNFNMYASTQAADGTMYFGTNNGITTFHPDKIGPLSIKARPTITEILLNDKIAKNLVCSTTKATNVSEIQSLELPYSENTLSFNFSAMEYSDPMQCLFQYKMEGVDKDWVQAGTLPFARYANLPAGNYTFLIKASNSDGEWNDTPRTLKIRITPPFYKTWWFLTLIALATIALVAYIVYLRLSKVIALQKIRLNLYENLHDDIGSRLTAIVLSVDMLMQKSAIKDDKLGQIGTISRNIVANMRRLVWATAPENDALSTVAQQMQTDKRVLLPTEVKFQLTMDKTLENLNIGGDKRYQMLSIFNEALTNIAKYAEATTVETRIEIRETDLIMTITDNGKGYDPTAKRDDSAMSSGHGLRNMQRRANRIKGSLDIASKLGVGTTVTLSFPLKDDTIWSKFTHLFSKSHQNR
jgi:ligand-binding sensor domain-containing protein/anti-sigma regulatory factor (Ser/Thr protein kinase)